MSSKHDGFATYSYFDRDRFIGERRVYCCGASYNGQSFSAYWPHVAYLCPSCGELWGRAVLTHHFKYSPLVPGHWSVELRPCVKHGDGQFLYSQSVDEIDSIPLLTRELFALIEGALNGNWHNNSN